jgi:hypothetical protein
VSEHLAAATVPTRRLRPLHYTFADAGVHAAMARLWARVRDEFAEARPRPDAPPERLVGEQPPAGVAAENL